MTKQDFIDTLIKDKQSETEDGVNYWTFDYQEISEIADELFEKVKKLEHHKDTTVGLYAIDKNSKAVDIDWIRKNNFRIDF